MNPLLDEKQVYLCENADNTLSILLDALHSEKFTLLVTRKVFKLWRKLAKYAHTSNRSDILWFGSWGFNATAYTHDKDFYNHYINVFHCRPASGICEHVGYIRVTKENRS